MVAMSGQDGHAVELYPLIEDAVRRNAELLAELTAALLDSLSQRNPSLSDEFLRTGLPAGMLLELGAVAQIAMWDLQGHRPYLPTELPTNEAAAADLLCRVESEPLQFRSIASATLSRQMMRLWLDNFSWDGESILGAGAVISAVDDDELVEAVAELLWNARHQNSHR